MPFFSIILPTYNRAHLLPRAITSVLAQTYTDFELIIIDDASTDATESCVLQYNDSRIRYIKNAKNQERCLSRNKGIQEARGTYICFLDSDDYHLPEHLEILENTIRERSFPKALFFTNAWNEENGIRTKRICPPLHEHNLFHYIVTYTFNPQRMCVHKEICQQHVFDPEVYVCEDLDFAARIACTHSIIQIEKRTTVYVHHSESFTSGDSLKPFKELENYNRIFAKKELRNKIPLVSKRRLRSMCYFHIAIFHQKKRNYIRMYQAIFKSIFLCPQGYNKKTNKILIALAVKGMFKKM